MSYSRRDTEGSFLGGDPRLPSEATPQPYSPEDEYAGPPPHWVPTAAPPVHRSGYGPWAEWNAPTLHSSMQDQRYDMPGLYANGYGVWAIEQQGATFTPAAGTDAVTPYMSQDQNNNTVNAANGPAAYYQDNRITATSGRDLHGQFTAGVPPGGVVDYGPALAYGASAHSVARNALPVQAFEPDDEADAPALSGENLRTLVRGYVLDPGTRIETVNMGPNRYGRLKMIIELEVADGV